MSSATTTGCVLGNALRQARAVMLLLIAFFLGVVDLHAQSAPGVGAYQFSNGVHPSLDATFDNSSVSEVTAYWRNELKMISLKVTNKKELIGASARIPSASADTMRILIAVEKPKGSAFTTARIAFLTINGYVGPDSPERVLNGCTEWVQQRTVTLRMQLAQAELTKAKRNLDNLTRQLDMLKREKLRAENGVLKAQQRGEQAESDRRKLEEQLKGILDPVNESGADSTERADMAKERLKDKRRMERKATSVSKTSRDMEKKLQTLQLDIKKNEAEQVAKQSEIDRQQQVVNDLQEKLKNIR